jgi:hypothetical protein
MIAPIIRLRAEFSKTAHCKIERCLDFSGRPRIWLNWRWPNATRTARGTPRLLGNVIAIDEERIKSELDRVVRGSVEETLNALLDAEADRLCNAQRYKRSEARRATRAGHYERNLQTRAGEVQLNVPKLRQQTFETAIIERYRLTVPKHFLAGVALVEQRFQ